MSAAGAALSNRLAQRIRAIRDFPVKGVVFRDITPLLLDPGTMQASIDHLTARYLQDPPDCIVGIESRGFLFGLPLALSVQRGFVPVRKPGKLPASTLRIDYDLEYGSAALEIHRDAICAGQRVLIVDDLLATGGTSLAAAQLVQRLGGRIDGFVYIVELAFLAGREKLRGYDVYSLLRYDSASSL